MSPWELLVCIGLVTASGFVSASETAFFSLSRIQLRFLRESFPNAHRRIRRLLADPAGLLLCLLVTNELLNISISTLVAGAVSEGWAASIGTFAASLTGLPKWAVHTLVGTLITAPVVLLFCEITPKVIAARLNQIVAPISAVPVTGLYRSLSPLRALARYATRWRRSTPPPGDRRKRPRSESHGRRGGAGDEPVLREEEILILVEEGHAEGTIHGSEVELIRNVFELDDATVADIYRPISRVFTLPASAPLRLAFDTMKTRKFARIPVTGEHKRQIVGTLYAKDLMLSDVPVNADAPIHSLMRRPLVVGPTTKLSTLFRRLRQNRNHLAVVENQPGDALGIVTMNDLLDTLLDDFLEVGPGHAPGGMESP